MCAASASVCVRVFVRVLYTFSSRTLTRFRYQCSTNRIEAEVWPRVHPLFKRSKIGFPSFFRSHTPFSSACECVCLSSLPTYEFCVCVLSMPSCRIVVCMPFALLTSQKTMHNFQNNKHRLVWRIFLTKQMKLWYLMPYNWTLAIFACCSFGQLWLGLSTGQNYAKFGHFNESTFSIIYSYQSHSSQHYSNK